MICWGILLMSQQSLTNIPGQTGIYLYKLNDTLRSHKPKSLNINQYICKGCARAEEPSLFSGLTGSTRVTYFSSRTCQRGCMTFGLKLAIKNTGCDSICQWRQAWGGHVWGAELLAWKYDYLQENEKVQFVSVILWVNRGVLLHGRDLLGKPVNTLNNQQ